MRSACCPELEQIFTELAEGRGPALEHSEHCERCAAILEEHRQLEKDLYRLADPLPPPDFVNRVMQKVAASPEPVRSEVNVGLGILFVAFGLFLVSLLAGGELGLGQLGVRLASTLVVLRELLIGLGSGIGVLWRTAAVPLTATMAAILFVSLVGLRRLAATEAKVSG